MSDHAETNAFPMVPHCLFHIPASKRSSRDPFCSLGLQILPDGATEATESIECMGNHGKPMKTYRKSKGFCVVIYMKFIKSNAIPLRFLTFSCISHDSALAKPLISLREFNVFHWKAGNDEFFVKKHCSGSGFGTIWVPKRDPTGIPKIQSGSYRVGR